MGGIVQGRFAPSPSGRMHLGNVLSFLLAWLDARAAGGTVVLRMEDLDPLRTGEPWASRIADDLRWLGLEWEEGFQVGGPNGPYCQRERTALYDAAFRALEEQGLLYPCWCSRHQRLAASAPHRSDGLSVYNGRCRALTQAQRDELSRTHRPAWRAMVPDLDVSFSDLCQGPYTEDLARDCGDFILRRSDGVYAYQLAVVVDDGDMGVTQVVRGSDLLSSTPRQIWLQRQLDLPQPEYGHVPLLYGADGHRLSKRQKDVDLGALRQMGKRPEDIVGQLACWAGLIDQPEPVQARELVAEFAWGKVRRENVVVE